MKIKINRLIAPYQQELKDYERIFNAYLRLQDTQIDIAYKLAQEALALAERFSEIHFELRKDEKLPDQKKDPPKKDRIYEIQSKLDTIHTHARMVWSRGKENI